MAIDQVMWPESDMRVAMIMLFVPRSVGFSHEGQDE